jgi:hypothetical protein
MHAMITKQILFAMLVGCFVVTWTAQHLAAQKHTPVIVTRIYTGQDGQTHAEKIEVKLQPQPNGGEQSDIIHSADALIHRFPPGGVTGWHTAPRRQYVITLSGHAEVELAKGKTFRVGPGQVVLAEDLTGKGHITRILASEDWIVLAVPLTDSL